MTTLLVEAGGHLGIAEDLLGVEELSLKMIVSLGENDVKNLEDFAYCSSDDLLGWDEVIDGEKKREEGILEDHDINISQANELIMSARIKLGIIPDESQDTEAHDNDSVDNDSETNNPLDAID